MKTLICLCIAILSFPYSNLSSTSKLMTISHLQSRRDDMSVENIKSQLPKSRRDDIFFNIPPLQDLILSNFRYSKKDALDEVRFLEGTWKTENKESYEVWKKNTDGTMEGYSYKMKANEKLISEYLSIKMIDGKLTYQARVPNQNNGQTIPFVLNADIKDQLSFENLNHDFPKKVQYKALDDRTILVSVLGEGDKGFRYRILKQPPAPKGE